MKTYLLLGANGQLGSELQRSFHADGHVVAHTRATCDLSDPKSIRAVVRSVTPDVILNAAAYTAVDRAASEPELAAQINATAPGVLAEEAKKQNALLIHYSTDYVFDGTKAIAWREDDPTNPLNVYGATKLAGERNVQQVGGRSLIFRTSWVYSPHGQNFLLTMLRLGQQRDELKIVNDQRGAPTSAAALAKATREIVLNAAEGDLDQLAGIYHMTCAGETTWCGFAQAIFANARAAKQWPIVIGIPASHYPTPARRPANSVLSNEKLTSVFGVELPPWENALNEALQSLNLRIA
ncbi:MAG TPA: dTDP-4-dehydrorhamnose reductase [Silvibacterium sp.]|nr:dTDP-4-dehydrorhamnose reductase [Silvibacterium sp.]